MENKIKEKKSNGSKVVIIILVILLIAACSYIAYDKFMAKDDTSNSNVQGNKKIKEENLDINSRLVQNLYSKVSVNKEDDSCLGAYYGSDKDFNSSEATEEIKMDLVSRLLIEKEKKVYSMDTTSIPDTVSDYESIVSINKKSGDSAQEYYYDRAYIEKLYKDVFGSKAKLDTNIGIKTSGAEIYYYIPSIDKYVLYMSEGSSVCSGKVSSTLQKAIKEGNELKLYGITTDTLDDGSISKNNYVYTFKLDEDGMYNFISRVKE